MIILKAYIIYLIYVDYEHDWFDAKSWHAKYWANAKYWIVIGWLPTCFANLYFFRKFWQLLILLNVGIKRVIFFSV